MTKIVFFSLFALLINCAGPENQPTPKAENLRQCVSGTSVPLPDTEKVVELDFFALCVPKSFEEREVSNKDTELWKFSDNRLHLSVEAGTYAARLDSLKDFPEYNEEWISVDNEKAKLVSFTYGERSNLLKDPNLKQVVAAYFPESPRVKTNLVIWLSFETKEDTESAIGIVRSVKFK